MAKLVRPKRKRVNMRIPAELLYWAKEYSRSRNISLTQIIIDHLTHLQEVTDDELKIRTRSHKIASNAR